MKSIQPEAVKLFFPLTHFRIAEFSFSFLQNISLIVFQFIDYNVLNETPA